MRKRQEQGQSGPRKRRKADPDLIFALDIGTRSVIGIVGKKQGEKFRVLAVESEEHAGRAMTDGQIEDIEQVSLVCRHVKERLERQIGGRLKAVCVAAAGRALKTQRASFALGLDPSAVMTQESICRLEAGGVEAAEQAFHPDETDGGEKVFYLVGYSVVEYRLDGYPITTLIGHRGRTAEADVIATFLPREVVDSLYAAMEKTGLEVASLTLEPIAAMNAAIPQKLRLLNLALADIGAGTSDIAVSKNGSVVSYTMATVAGDEITEAIMKRYLVDFPTAERVKHGMGGDEALVFRDILGFDQSIAPARLREETEPAVRALCAEIARDMKDANGGEPPSAVFLVGGGSKLPGMCAFVAQALGLPENRVAIGGNNFTAQVESPEFNVTGPEFATPLGIAVSAAFNLISDSFSVTLNGGRAKLFRSNQLTVLDVLMMNGYGYNQMLSRSGRSIVVEINGENRAFYGGHPHVARILLNGKEAVASALVHAGDAIVFEPALAGEDAHPLLREAVPCWTDAGTVRLNGTERPVGTLALVNGEPALSGTRLNHRDRVAYQQVLTLRDLLREAELPLSGSFFVNGQKAAPETALSPGDDITAGGEEKVPTAEQPPFTASKAEESAPERGAAAENTREEPGRGMTVSLNGAEHFLPPKAENAPYFLMDLLNFVEFDLSKPEGRRILLQINGRDAAYLQKIENGDTISIRWEERSAG